MLEIQRRKGQRKTSTAAGSFVVNYNSIKKQKTMLIFSTRQIMSAADAANYLLFTNPVSSTVWGIIGSVSKVVIADIKILV